MSLEYYFRLLDYRERIEAFRTGIERSVRQGDRVLELGTGLGTFAFFAARAGAGRVWAVDAHPVIHLARDLARANDLDERIEFVRGRLPGVALPGFTPDDPFDVLVFEDFTRTLLDDRTYRTLVHCQEELLAPDGVMIPARARLALAPARIGLAAMPRDFPRSGVSWDEDGGRYGIDWLPARPYLASLPRRGFLPGEAMVGEPVVGPTLSLRPPPRADDLGLAGEWSDIPDGIVDAILLWIELEPAEGVWISNAPGSREALWGQVILPLDPPLEVAFGDTLSAAVTRNAFEDGAPGWVNWTVEAGGERITRSEFASFPAELSDLYEGESVPPSLTADSGSSQIQADEHPPHQGWEERAP